MSRDILAILDAAEEALYSRRDPAAARTALGEVELASISDPALLCDLAAIWLDLQEDDRATAVYSRAAALDDQLADAHYGLGLLAENRGDRNEMIARFLRTHELDSIAPIPEIHISPDEFEAVVESAMRELPPRAIQLLENVAVVVADLPERALIEDGYDPRLLGLFSGIELTHAEPTSGQPLAPDVIHLFQRNLERGAADTDELREEIRITLLHETAHFFGLDDDQLDDLGLG